MGTNCDLFIRHPDGRTCIYDLDRHYCFLAVPSPDDIANRGNSPPKEYLPSEELLKWMAGKKFDDGPDYWREHVRHLLEAHPRHPARIVSEQDVVWDTIFSWEDSGCILEGKEPNWIPSLWEEKKGGAPVITADDILNSLPDAGGHAAFFRVTAAPPPSADHI